LVTGIRQGGIVDSIELVNAITKLLKSLKVKSGLKIESVNINLSGQDITTKHSRAIIPLAERGNKVIGPLDIQRVNDQARVLGSSLQEEIIHTIPFGYSIDSKSNIMNPAGLYSHKLEVDLYLICGRLSSVQSFSRAINQSGCTVKRMIFSGLATSKVILNPDYKEGLNLFCDIGADVTQILFFNNGCLRDVEILSVGGDNLTAQLSDTLKIPFDLSEDIKRSHGMITDLAMIRDDKEILVKKSSSYKPIKQKAVIESLLLSSRLLCNQIKEAIEKKVSSYQVNNLIVAGRTVLLEGFIESLENTLSIPVRLGRIEDEQVLGATKELQECSSLKYLTYLTSLGMVSFALEKEPCVSVFKKVTNKNIFKKTVDRFREVYQEYF
jgi:cell division protein FtsA